jgi:hypothetical protein
MNGHKSHQMGKGAPKVKIGFLTAARKTAKKVDASVQKPFEGMQSYCSKATWCTKCAATAAGAANGKSHSRLGAQPEDPKYPNCSFFKSTALLTKVKKRQLVLMSQEPSADGQEARLITTRELPTREVLVCLLHSSRKRKRLLTAG